jgi:hypothetical protein
MSWDLFIMRLPEGLKSTEDIPEDFEPPALGTLKEVHASLCEVLPELPLENGIAAIEVEGGSVEIYVGEDDPVQSVMLCIRGEEPVLDVVNALVEVLGGQALDAGSESGVYDPAHAAESLRGFNEYAAQFEATERKSGGKDRKKVSSKATKKAGKSSKKAATSAAKKSAKKAGSKTSPKPTPKPTSKAAPKTAKKTGKKTAKTTAKVRSTTASKRPAAKAGSKKTTAKKKARGRRS